MSAPPRRAQQVQRGIPQQQVHQDSGWAFDELGFDPRAQIRAPMVDHRGSMVERRAPPPTDYSSYVQQSRPPTQQSREQYQPQQQQTYRSY